jgi:hypothetical protein
LKAELMAFCSQIFHSSCSHDLGYRADSFLLWKFIFFIHWWSPWRLDNRVSFER